MKINRRQADGIEVFELEGELDFHSSPAVREKFQEVAQKPGARMLILLDKVSYIDSSGLATFVEVLQKMKRANGKLVLAGLQPAVKSVFEIAKLDKVFTLAGSESDARPQLA